MEFAKFVFTLGATVWIVMALVEQVFIKSRENANNCLLWAIFCAIGILVMQ